MSAANAPSYKIGLAGCGKMGSAMVRAWIEKNLLSHIDILEPGPAPANIAALPNTVFYQTENDFAQCAEHWDMLVVAVKPQTLDHFAKALGPLPASLPVLSIAAGKTIQALSDSFGKQNPIIRSMPNTPAAIGEGMTVACAGANIDDAAKDIAQTLLSSLGMFAWTADESLMDAVTAVSGSGPAYVFYLIECLSEAGQKAGLPADMALTLARQTIIGSAALVKDQADLPPSTLRGNVTSPNGTTAAALEILMEGTWKDILAQAVLKARDRGKELSS